MAGHEDPRMPPGRGAFRRSSWRRHLGGADRQAVDLRRQWHGRRSADIVAGHQIVGQRSEWPGFDALALMQEIALTIEARSMDYLLLSRRKT